MTSYMRPPPTIAERWPRVALAMAQDAGYEVLPSGPEAQAYHWRRTFASAIGSAYVVTSDDDYATEAEAWAAAVEHHRAEREGDRA